SPAAQPLEAIIRARPVPAGIDARCALRGSRRAEDTDATARRSVVVPRPGRACLGGPDSGDWPDRTGTGTHRRVRKTISARVCACGAVLAAILMAMAAGSAAAQDGKAMVVKLATATLNDAQHEWLKRFAVAIEKNTNGRLKGEVFPASQLGAIPRMIE